MVTFKVSLNTMDMAKDFANTASKYDFDIDLSSDRYVVNAKSIMGIFSLDLSKAIKVDAHVDEAQAGELKADMAKFIVD